MLQCKSSVKKVVLTQSDSIAPETSKEITYLLPEPSEVLADIISEKMIINPRLVNPISNSQYYLDRKPLALNLGVYFMDFAFLNSNNNKTNTLEYFQLIRDLCQKMNISGVFNETFFNRVHNNLMDNDSLIIIANEMYNRLSEVLENSSRAEDYALISAGAFIESLYLSTKSITDFKKYKFMVKKLFEQKLLFENYYAFMYQFRNDNDIQTALTQMDRLKVIFNLVNSKEIQKTVITDQKNHIIIKGGLEVEPNEKAFIKFDKGISKIRQSIIQY